MKLIYVVLDGAADGSNPVKSSLATAFKPNIDLLATTAHCGLVYTVSQGVAPESDEAVISILGYDPEKYYTGRGPLEALGAGVDFKEGQVALRANFATVDPKTYRILDRRAGRGVTKSEALELARAVDGMKLDKGLGEARFIPTVGHRGVLVLSHRDVKLSANITNTDPAYERVGLISKARASFEPYVQLSKPLDERDPGAVKAAQLLNEFTRKAIDVLSSHPVNQQRTSKGLLPANAILARDAGDRLPAAPPITSLYGLRFASITEMPVERGIAKALGLTDLHYEVEGKTKEQILVEEADLVADNLDKFDAFYVHLKGPDEPGHDGNFEAKVAAIELIDRYFFSRLLSRVSRDEVLFIVTSDHATPWTLKSHSDDPVPIMLSNPKLGKGPGKFDERSCSGGRLGLLRKGVEILPLAIRYLRELSSS
ncbi:MAG: alkaline phosphatase family protein [Acidilobus sp.]|nr:alkaline phosphatase family protein [Acidilobus sp.]MCG2889292.1 alkaline phosphatase family protein [Acidilobus sp.]MCG2890726.1 alkaline phosphatase family protein [Acidilobus sp.]